MLHRSKTFTADPKPPAEHEGKTKTMTTKQKATEVVAAAQAAAEQGFAQAQKGFEQAQAYAQENMNKGVKATEEFVAFAQGNVEAFTKSAQILVAGLQDLNKSAFATAQALAEENVAKAKEFAAVRSLKDAVELHTAFVKGSIEKSLAETQKLGEGYFRLAEQALAPLTARFQVAVEKFGKAA